MPPRISTPSAISTKGVVIIADDDADSPQLLERSSSSKIAAMAERRISRGLEMQQQLVQAQQDLKKLKGQLTSVEKEKSRLLNELMETKKVADDATLRFNMALSAHKQAEDGWELEKVRSKEIEQASIESAQKRDQAWQLELEAVQKQHALDAEALSSVEQELAMVCKELFFTIEAKDKALKDAEVARRVADDNRKRVNDLSMELDSLKRFLGSASSNQNGELGPKQENVSNIQENPLVESRKREFQKGKDMEAQLLENKETEMPIANLLSESRKRIEMLELELKKTKESEAKTCESLVYQTKQLEESNISLEEAKFQIASLHESIRSLEAAVGKCSEELILHARLGMHSVGHEPSPLLVSASSQKEIQDANTETEVPKVTLNRIRKKFQAFLNGAMREIDCAKEEAEKWRLENEESQDAWNGKEAVFVQYMKKCEEERDYAKEEIGILAESLMKAEETAKKAREETLKLRDLLKQAVNEATIARESAEIARTENCQLKDDLSCMGSKFQYVTQENERLKISEAEALEQVKKLRNLLSVSSSKENGTSKKVEEPTAKLSSEQSRAQQNLNVRLETLRTMNGSKDDDNPGISKGLTFNRVEGTRNFSNSFSYTTNRKALSVSGESDTLSLGDFDGSHFDNMGSEKSSGSGRRKKKPLLQRLGSLLKRRTNSGAN